MAATRLTDSQKSELVARYSAGAASAALAAAYGCSVNTVSRVVKAALAPADYEQLKQARARGVSLVEPAAGPGADPDVAGKAAVADDGNGPMQVAMFSPSRDHGVDDRDDPGLGEDGRGDQRDQDDLAKDLADADLADVELDDDLDDEFGDDLEDDDLDDELEDDDLGDDEAEDDEGDDDDDLDDEGVFAGAGADRERASHHPAPPARRVLARIQRCAPRPVGAAAFPPRQEGRLMPSDRWSARSAET